MKKANVSKLFMMSLRSLVAVVLFAALTNCTSEEELTAPPAEVVAAEENLSTSSTEEGASLTVSGAYVEYRDGDLCSECTYVIPEDATVVDGAKLGIEAGDVICLNSAFKYAAVELVNVEGSEGNPVVVANCNE
jgi:hypothetical protein